MFDLSIEKLFILAVVALFVLGPERLPAAAAWLARTLRQIKTYANEANHQIRRELGPGFNEIRTPLDDLRSDLAGLGSWRDPRASLISHLREDPIEPHPDPLPPGGGEPTAIQRPANSPPRPLAARELPPIDLDAT